LIQCFIYFNLADHAARYAYPQEQPVVLSEPADPGSIAAVASGWLADLARLIEAGDTSGAGQLFGPDASWR
jgi:hypothetical protein